jgi:Tfp pilus assembly protein PilP
MTRQFLLAPLVLAVAWPAFAQAPAQGAKPERDTKPGSPEVQAPAPTSPTAPLPPTPPANYGYAVDGRRDPFVALLGNTGGKKPTGPVATVRAEGAAGIGTDELSVKGILQSQGTWVAMVAGPSGRVYTVHQGDRIADGTIRGITPQFVLIVQQVNDPLSLEKQREVRKFLRGGDNK